MKRAMTETNILFINRHVEKYKNYVKKGVANRQPLCYNR